MPVRLAGGLSRLLTSTGGWLCSPPLSGHGRLAGGLSNSYRTWRERVKVDPIGCAFRQRLILGLLLGASLLSGRTRAQVQEPSAPLLGRDISAVAELKGRPVLEVRISGNTIVPTAIILNDIRTHVGDPFDPSTVTEDYQRVFKTNKFANVEARVEPRDNGVIVSFEVTEQKVIHHINFAGNVPSDVSTDDIKSAVDLREGEAIDRFRITLARQAIEKLYHDKNFPFAHVQVSDDELARTGDLTFTIVQGPQVRIRKIDFIGNDTFSDWKLKDQIKSAYYIFIFRPGTFDPEEVDEDVASLRKFYQDKGFFDARVGRKLTFSADQTDLKITFVIDEGPRFVIDHVRFEGNSLLSEAELRKHLNLVETMPYDHEVIDRDTRELVRAYSPSGLIYEQTPGAASNPDYLDIETKPVFSAQRGHIDLVYQIHEGKSFHLGRILVKGNEKTQDKVILREMRLSPGQVYNSAEVADAQDRLRGTPYFSSVVITPIGEDPNVRDLLVEVTEQRTASVQFGVGVNSNGGVGGDLTYEQKNFDIANPPATLGDLFTDRAFGGAGQDFRASFEPGTEATAAVLSFTEPYLFDQPYSFSSQAYLEDRLREDYIDRRVGGTISFGKRFDYVYSASVSFRAENVTIADIQDKPDRATQILDGEGHHVLTSIGLQLQRDTTNHGPIPYKGDNLQLGVEQYGAMGGQLDFTRLSGGLSDYTLVGEDLLDRRTVLDLHGLIGDDLTRAPFFERFYGGGIGSIRGFEYRGVTPRGGPDDDRIGGDFSVTGGAELGYPLAADVLRGVVFVDAGDVEKNVKFGVIRSAIGTGFRLVLPFLGQIPIALDFAIPITKSHQDQVQVVSFSLGIPP